MAHRILTLTAVVLFVAAAASITLAQAPEDPAHQELRALRAEVLKAITSGNVEDTLKFVHPNVVITWQNHDVVRGHQGVRDFMRRMGADAFRGYRVEPTPDDLTILYGGDMGVSFGTSVAEYRLLGMTLSFTNRWTATLVKEDGRWMLASYQVSNNVLNNPILTVLMWAGVLALIVGIVAGFVLGRRRVRRAY